MKKTKKLFISRETVRQLGGTELRHAAGGLSGKRCSDVLTGCAECQPQHTLYDTACYACNWTDRCTDGCSEGFPCP